MDFLLYIKALFEEHYVVFKEFTKANPVFGGILGMWLMGLLTYFFKNIPLKIFNFIKKHLTVVVTLNSRHESFHDFVKWFEKGNKVKKLRTVRLSNGMWGNSMTRVSIGLGSHFFFHNFRPYWLKRVIQNSKEITTVEEISLSTIGFKQDGILNLIKETIPKASQTSMKIKNWSNNSWAYLQDLEARPINSVILKRGQKERIISFIKDFENQKEWYKINGIPYRTGVLLSGPPGTGKTSLIRSLCSYLKKDLCIIDCSVMTDKTFQNALAKCGSNSVVLLEDFDSIKSIKDRSGNCEDIFDSGISLSGLLNGIDGVYSSNGRIIIATTNIPEKLDPALIRPGRFDLIEKLDYADSEMALQMFNKFFPENNVEKINLGEGISCAQIENCFMLHKNNPILAKKAIEKLKGGTVNKLKKIKG